jgi:N-methylhydantoinase A
VPPYPGIGSAMGLLQTEVRHVYVQSSVGRLSRYPVESMNRLFADLEARAFADIREEGFPANAVRLTRQLDLRYPHQGYQLGVDCKAGAIAEADLPALKAAFDAAHQRIYGAAAADEDAEVVTFRVIAEIAVPTLTAPRIERGDGDTRRALIGERPLYHLEPRAFRTAAIYDRSRLRAADRLAGPAVVQQFDSTTVVLAGQSAEVDDYGNLIIKVAS